MPSARIFTSTSTRNPLVLFNPCKRFQDNSSLAILEYRPTCREAIVTSNTQIPDIFPSASCFRILRFGSSDRKFPISPVQGALLTCARLSLMKISSILVLQFLPICAALAPVQPPLLPILHLGGMLLPPKIFQHYIALTNRILHHWQSEVKSYLKHMERLY
jgi:hypothetical protein